ncbi:hypothetical protein NLX86_23930 [Streptomyces sp. A3M-1-3]|uniref:hypothetical protein n=1 Tax=Streptomyces sp. A3M-1-3 TaxID=2962044 RepID=UPI0020B722A0|nr:hypothetical protein [Streptomyces sp. A3M-1-3]MCP3821031.1 hypothetical protein [Streptomyces sp. A3M-1-3]
MTHQDRGTRPAGGWAQAVPADLHRVLELRYLQRPVVVQPERQDRRVEAEGGDAQPHRGGGAGGGDGAAFPGRVRGVEVQQQGRQRAQRRGREHRPHRPAAPAAPAAGAAARPAA